MDYLDTKYINGQYQQLGICRDDFESMDWFNPNIYPDCMVIPKCAQCQSDFELFKSRTDKEDKMKIKWKHPTACLWFDYYLERIRQIVKNPKFVKEI